MSLATSNFWKDAYKGTWKASAKRESYFKKMFEESSGCVLIGSGLGTESTEYISGSASSNGYEKGAPDFNVAGSNIFIEVTGPLSPKVKLSDPLWFRPDKIEHAY